jgi:hypothetical protein
MAWSSFRICAWYEVAVVMFQVAGVVGLCLSRLAPASTWARWGRTGFVFALIGLGLAGALCGGHDSEFALFAGGTMTVLLIGMTVGSGHGHATATSYQLTRPEPTLIG